MKKYFHFTKLKQNFILFLLLMIFFIAMQCYGGGEWSVREMIIGNSITIFMFIFGTLITDWFQMKNHDTHLVGIKKYFQFTRLKEDFHGFLLCITIMIVCQWHDNHSIKNMITSSFIFVITCILGSLIFDWIQIKNGKVKE